MKERSRAGVVAALGLLLGLGSLASSEDRKGAAMTTRASGPFDVKVAPLATDEKGEGISLGRLSLDKQFHGDLAGTGKGEMLTAGTPVKGSAGYVAIEWVSGTLHGRRGTFVLQHSGIMTRGTPQLALSIVPDSGTGELTGIAGTMAIKIEPDGKHFYELEYTIGEKR
jgi:hypothetical protein